MSDLKNEKSLKEMLFDEEAREVIELTNSKNEKLRVEQVFATEYMERAYCILAPINEIKGLEKGTGLVFSIEDEGVCLVKNKELCAQIFNLYYMDLRNEEAGDE